MMMAMYRGDAAMVDAVFTEDGTLQRVKPDGTVTENALPRWRDWVSTLEIGQAHEEMTRDGENWRVTVGMDVQAPKESCESYKATVLAAENET